MSPLQTSVLPLHCTDTSTSTLISPQPSSGNILGPKSELSPSLLITVDIFQNLSSLTFQQHLTLKMTQFFSSLSLVSMTSPCPEFQLISWLLFSESSADSSSVDHCVSGETPVSSSWVVISSSQGTLRTGALLLPWLCYQICFQPRFSPMHLYTCQVYP